MTIGITYFTDRVPEDKPVQIFRRSVNTGEETPLHNVVSGRQVYNDFLWGGVELVIREAPRPVDTSAE